MRATDVVDQVAESEQDRVKELENEVSSKHRINISEFYPELGNPKMGQWANLADPANLKWQVLFSPMTMVLLHPEDDESKFSKLYGITPKQMETLIDKEAIRTSIYVQDSRKWEGCKYLNGI